MKTVYGCKVEFMWLKERKGLFLSPSPEILYSGFLLYGILIILSLYHFLVMILNCLVLSLLPLSFYKPQETTIIIITCMADCIFQKWFQWALLVHMHFFLCNFECPSFELWESVTMAEVRLTDLQGNVMRVNAVSAWFSWGITFKEVHSDPERSSWNVKEVLSSPGWGPSWQSIQYYWKY